jgi:hypothetical protein
MLNTSLITHAVSWGIGRHIYYLTPIETINAIKFEFIAQVRSSVNSPVVNSLKCSRIDSWDRCTNISKSFLCDLSLEIRWNQQTSQISPLVCCLEPSDRQYNSDSAHPCSMPTFRSLMESCRRWEMLEQKGSGVLWLLSWW